MVEKQKCIAHTLVDTDIGYEADTLKNLRKIDGVVDTTLVYGVYSGMVHIEALTLDQVRETVGRKILHVDHVRSTYTMVEIADKNGPLGFKRGKNPGEFEFIHPSLE
jgi:DNA-binding Lrp family transcriptional regulator